MRFLMQAVHLWVGSRLFAAHKGGFSCKGVHICVTNFVLGDRHSLFDPFWTTPLRVWGCCPWSVRAFVTTCSPSFTYRHAATSVHVLLGCLVQGGAKGCRERLAQFQWRRISWHDKWSSPWMMLWKFWCSFASCPHEMKLELREAKPGGFQTRVFPAFFGKGPDCVADPFGTVPRRCS